MKENKQFKYDITVLIPVYNAEKFLNDCINSVINQTYDFNKIEIVLVNDGSADNSLEICKKIEEKYDNVKLINQENKGVSAARNNGLKKATGKYILFLDSDDYLSKESISNIVSFFNKHSDEIDIVTYPIYHDKFGEIIPHHRYSKYYKKGTAVYDLVKYPYLIQATINVCIKNFDLEIPKFDETQKFSEDERFDAEIIMKKEKIGFVKEAGYYWRKHNFSANNNISNPMFCFEKLISYYEYLFNKFEKDDKVPEYIQYLFINTFFWRTLDDLLLPYHYEKKDFESAINKVNNLLKKIDIKVIGNHKKLSVYNKIRILEIQNKQMTIDYANNEFVIKCDGNDIFSSQKIIADVRKINHKNNTLKIFSPIITPFLYFKDVELFLETLYNNNKKTIKKLDLYPSNILKKRCDYYQVNPFNIDVEINTDKIKSFTIYAKYLDKKIPVKWRFLNTNINFVSDKKIIKRRGKKIVIEKATLFNRFKNSLRKNISIIKNDKKIFFYNILKNLYIKKKPIYIYNDRNDLIDNAYYQFKHDIKIKDGVNRYYITSMNKDKINSHFDKKEQKHIVKFYSLKHRLLFLKSKMIFTSFIDKIVYHPFYKQMKVSSKLKSYELIYLQHGVLHVPLESMYSKEFTEIDKFVISSNFEKENLIEKYNYKLEDLILSTMSRNNSQEFNITTTRTRKRIVFAPSWRKYLIGKLEDGKREIKTSAFENSTYFKEINNLFKSKELNKILEKYNIELIFQLHPIFKDYKNLFPFNDYIKPSEEGLNVYDCDLFITDFSSFQFDFIKLQKPLIYFIPDKKEFNAGLHTYRELYLKENNAFGPFVYNYEDLIINIKKIIENDWQTKKKYLHRMNKFFYNVSNPCDMIYETIKKENKTKKK